METLDLNPQNNLTRSAAFLLMYSTDGKPWEGYMAASEQQRAMVVPQVLAIGRSDGCIGFVGGILEDVARGETASQSSVENGLRREVKEEIGYDLPRPPEPLMRVRGPHLDKYVFSLEVPHQELRSVACNAHTGIHFGSEITGTLLLQIADYEAITGHPFGGLQNVLRLPFSGSAVRDLSRLIIKRSLMSQETFERVRAKTNV